MFERRQCDFAVHGFRQEVYVVEENDILDTEFALNVVGTTQFPTGLVVTGTITAEAAGTASKYSPCYILT